MGADRIPALLYFRADSCSVCVEKAPLVREIADELKLPLEVIHVGTEAGRLRASELRIQTVPVLAMVDGGRVPFRLVGRMITWENVRHLVRMTRRRHGGSE